MGRPCVYGRAQKGTDCSVGDHRLEGSEKEGTLLLNWFGGSAVGSPECPLFFFGRRRAQNALSCGGRLGSAKRSEEGFEAAFVKGAELLGDVDGVIQLANLIGVGELCLFGIEEAKAAGLRLVGQADHLFKLGGAPVFGGLAPD